MRERGRAEHHHACGNRKDVFHYFTRFFDEVAGRNEFRSGRHWTSVTSVSSLRLNRLVNFQSPAQFFGSVIVYSTSNVPSLIIRYRSIMRASSLIGTDCPP